MKVFFSHATEDKAIVEQIFLRVIQKFPEIKGWLDKYEILGGDDLIEKVHSGIEEADKFLIFLSPASIDKPWVKTELRKALMSEIHGIKSEFIIPIKIGHISQSPAFLESRFYIDIESKTEEEWLADVYNAITRQKKNLDAPTDNLLIIASIAADEPNAVIISFEAQFWAEPIGFRVVVKENIKLAKWEMPTLKGMQQVSISELNTKLEYAVRIYNHSIKPKNPFHIKILFPTAGDPQLKIASVNKWDGEEGAKFMNIMSFN